METCKLTNIQKKYLPAIKWLISDSRGEGKTFLLAVAFIDKAINYPHTWVYPFDHFEGGGLQAKMFLMCMIKNIIENDKKLLEKTEFRKESFRIN